MTDSSAGAVARLTGSDEIAFLARWGLDGSELPSETALREVLSRRRDIIAGAPPSSSSVESARISHVLCLPVACGDQLLGAVYLDRRGWAAEAYDDSSRILAEAFCSALALSLHLSAELDSTRELLEETGSAAIEVRELALASRDYWRLGDIRTHSPVFADCLARAERAARSSFEVLLLGETGVGKNHLAHVIHSASERRGGPFVLLQCSAVPESLLESELFGHEKGAFTDAVGRRKGKIELAAGGTLFIDEIDELGAAVQVKLLELAEKRAFYRVGGEELLSSDVRIMAATNRHLKSEARAGRFRKDLYYRLNTIPLAVPPLRARREDIPALAASFLREACALSSRREPAELEPEAMRLFEGYHWPGNVRELRNYVRRLVALTSTPAITARDILLHPFDDVEPAPRTPSTPLWLPGASLAEALESFERQVLEAAIGHAGTIAGAARLLGLPRRTMTDKCQRFGVRPRGKKPS
ncbi:MAG: sigma-54-dependent Fis family transcriptional regulator [Candidatus Schekmanbacteria bacterium]|nr:sigma-54-dependent Fis family transcriptional regulator [Candidatus Schekmanbacteria bacterium]